MLGLEEKEKRKLEKQKHDAQMQREIEELEEAAVLQQQEIDKACENLGSDL